ncbi:MAG: alpha-glucosidase [Lachnospiraceae bacterium]|nr:alpha-glucosidase [Lachnospiraceae bacterium]
MSGASKVTMQSKLKEVYASPVGKDILGKVLMQLGLGDWVVTNPVVGNITLAGLKKLAGKRLDDTFFTAIINMLNAETGEPAGTDGAITKQWWKEAVFYQIYPRSFYDTNHDGIGDLRGIIEKLDYLKELGVDALWLSPIYDSPNDDNGYDIRDYRKIMQEFGTMEDFDELLAKVHEKGMRLIMDLVINHTSDEHEWFVQGLQDETSKYRDYYMFRLDDGTKTLPNNWVSFFSGPAWNYYEEQKLWGLHLFSKKQMDLNWDNPALRDELVDMINWWLDKGVDGFRMDVINYISKPEGLPQGNELIGSMMEFTGVEQYFYGPNLHKYLHEVRMRAFEPHGAFSVGETPGIGLNMARMITGEERKELDMVFNFDQLETPGHVRFDDYKYDLNYYRDYMIQWMENYGNNCWMSLFYNNHDNPRMISKVSTEEAHAVPLARLLATMQFTLKGTPFMFQGDEMGLVNYSFISMEEVYDVEAKGKYAELLEAGKTPEEAFKVILAGTREHTRVLLPWNEFPEGTRPELIQKVRTEVTEFYRELIALRHQEPALVYGEFKVLDKSKDRFVYSRTYEGKEYVIDCNLGAKPRKAWKHDGYEMVLLDDAEDMPVLGAYEARIYVK